MVLDFIQDLDQVKVTYRVHKLTLVEVNGHSQLFEDKEEMQKELISFAEELGYTIVYSLETGVDEYHRDDTVTRLFEKKEDAEMYAEHLEDKVYVKTLAAKILR